MLIKAGLSIALFFSPLIASTAFASSWLTTGRTASIPFGHMEYCKRHRYDCGRHGGVSRLADARLATLNRVNLAVNRSIEPMSDQKAHGTREIWLASTRAGDCEDYVLAKRNQLLRRGFKPGHLRIAVGRSRGEIHAVLVVRTTQGDFVLDNNTDEILPVNRSRMRFAKVQSASDSSQWVRVTGRTSDPDRVTLR